MKLRAPHWLATLPLSLALHAGALAGVVALLGTENALPPLVIDLKAVAPAREDGDTGLGHAGAPNAATQRAPATSAARSERPAPSASRAVPPSRPASSLASPSMPAATPAPPTPAPHATAVQPEPAPTRLPEPVPPRVREDPAPAPASPSVTASTPAPPASVSDRPANTSDAGRAAGSPRSDAAASGAPGSPTAGASGTRDGGGVVGGAGDRVAAVPRGDGTGARDGTGLGTEYDAYYARIRQRIQQTARYPGAARTRRLAGTVELEITIAADGAVANVAVVLSSSHELLDRAAVEAARALPRTPFPRGVAPRPLTFVIPVSFELQ